MKQISKDVFKKIYHLSQDVKNSLESKGIAIPVENEDGSITFGTYKVKKDLDGFYNIYDYANFPVVEKINLPQTAILLANGLALGKFLDQTIILLDRQYGYALFEESLYKKIRTAKKINIHKLDVCIAKDSVLKRKKDGYRKEIVSRFEKLRQNI